MQGTGRRHRKTGKKLGPALRYIFKQMKRKIQIQLFLDPQYWDSNLQPLFLDPSGIRIFIRIYPETHPSIRKIIQILLDSHPEDRNPNPAGTHGAIQ